MIDCGLNLLSDFFLCDEFLCNVLGNQPTGVIPPGLPVGIFYLNYWFILHSSEISLCSHQLSVVVAIAIIVVCRRLS